MRILFWGVAIIRTQSPPWGSPFPVAEWLFNRPKLNV